MTKTHYDVMQDVGEGWDFKQDFIQTLTNARTEYKNKHAIAYAFGAEVEPTGRYFCELCDGYLHEEACERYEDWIRDILKREVVDEYIQKTCPECHTPIEEMRYVKEVVSEPIISTDVTDMSELSMVEVEEKRQYLPCEHMFEIGEEKIRWDLDNKQLQRDVAEGKFFRYDGRVFKSIT